MRSLDTFFQQIQHKPLDKHTSQRAELIETILQKVNQEREGTEFKPTTAVRIAVKLKGIKTGDLVGFVKECSQSTSFSRCFFGKLKKK